MSARTITSDRIRISFDDGPFAIREILNTAAGTTVLAAGAQSFLIRTPRRISDPAFLTDVVASAPVRDGLRFTVADESRKYKAIIGVTASPEGIRMTMRASAPVPVWVAEWKLSGLRVDEVIVPGLGGQVLGKSMPPDTALTYKYPFWWNAQFAVGSMKAGGFWLRMKDQDPLFKFLRVRKESEGFALSLGIEATAPLVSKTVEGTWYLDCYSGDWRVPTDLHRKWLERSFGLCPLDTNPSMPAWGKGIDFVLEIWGAGKDRAVPLHTFEEMEEVLRRWAPLHEPGRTLVYLPGFAEHGIDSHAPSYNPSPMLGGEKKFQHLMEVAHRMGYRVMLHTNALCMTFDHPLFGGMKKYQVIDQFDRAQGWALDIDGDWLTEPYFAYMNPGAKAWRDVMRKTIGGLIDRYSPDGIFLDQTLLAFNVSKGANFLTGMNTLVSGLQKAFPETLFAGEGLHELIVSAMPMAQIHGIDSLTEVHGIEGRVPWRKAHPVSTYLFGKYTRFTAHLLTKHPSHPYFSKQEEVYSKLGVIPALCLYNSGQAVDTPGTRKMIRRAKNLRMAPASGNRSGRTTA